MQIWVTILYIFYLDIYILFGGGSSNSDLCKYM